MCICKSAFNAEYFLDPASWRSHTLKILTSEKFSVSFHICFFFSFCPVDRFALKCHFLFGLPFKIIMI